MRHKFNRARAGFNIKMPFPRNLAKPPRKGGPTQKKQISADFHSRLDVARKLGITIQCVINWEKKGLLTPYRLPGGAIRYRSEEVDALVK